MTAKRMYIGIIASVMAETDTLTGHLAKKEGHPIPLFTGRLHGKLVVLVISGIGKVNAAHAATLLVNEYAPHILINIGIAGAYPSSGLGIGDIAVADREIYADEGVMLQDEFHGTELIGIPLLNRRRKRYFNEFPLDHKLTIKAVKAAGHVTHHPSPITIKKGTFLTLSTCTGTNNRALELENRYGAICENMEGAAIAHVCSIYETPFMEVRGISNMVGERNQKKWNIKLAAKNCQRAVLHFMGSI